MRRFLLPLLTACTLLAGCDLLGIEPASAVAAQKEAEGKAVGAACRHANRAIEDCYALNRKTDKAAIYAGWREMNDYMRENKIDPVTPTLTPLPNGGKADAVEDATADKGPDKGADKVPEKASDKPTKDKARASAAH